MSGYSPVIANIECVMLCVEMDVKLIVALLLLFEELFLFLDEELGLVWEFHAKFLVLELVENFGKSVG